MVEFSLCSWLIDRFADELEMNFGEYEFVYPDGEVDTTPTTGKSVRVLESGHAMFLEDAAVADCSCDRRS